jgi:hypothetical protein
MFIARARTIRTAVAAAALVGAGFATSASAQQAHGLTSTNIAASNNSGGGSSTTKTAQRAAGAASEHVICVRAQRVASRITQDFCHTSADWERQGGLLPENY